MHRISLVATTLAVATSAAFLPLAAQSIAGVPVEFGVMGGFTKPVGNLAGDANHSWNVGGLMSLGAPSSHVSFRLDGQWAQLNGREFGGALLCFGCVGSSSRTDYRVLNSTANIVYGGTLSGPTRLYLIGGVGVYNERGTKFLTTTNNMSDVHTSQEESVTRFGLNGGAGARFQIANHAAFIEARYHNLFGRRALIANGFSGDSPASFQFVPINVGFIF